MTDAQPKKVWTKEEIKALRLAKAKAMAAAHGTKESNINSKAVQESVNQVNEQFKLQNLQEVAQTIKEEPVTAQPQQPIEPSIDFSVLKTLEAKKADNQVSKRLYRFCSAICQGLLFCYFTSAGTNLNLSLTTFLLGQITLVLLLESIEKYTYTNKIDVSPLSLQCLFQGHQAIDKAGLTADEAAWYPGPAGGPG